MTGPIVGATALLLGPFILTACRSTTPSARVQNEVNLPMPQSAGVESIAEPPLPVNDRGTLKLSATSLIALAFNRQPDIASSFEAFKAEEARYDFFFTSRDALTPQLSVSNTFDESRTLDDDTGHREGTQNREHDVEVGVDKHFFDTTTVRVTGGLNTWTEDGDIGNQPFVSANVRYPLGESREKLERASEDIYRQNELNDTQLSYIEQVRERLKDALERLYEVLELRERVASGKRWQHDLLALSQRLDAIEGRAVANDRRRVEAERTRVRAEVRNLAGRARIELARLKHACGIPYKTEIEFVKEPFNPFEGISHADLLRVSIETDPEIATLRNAMRNAEVQLDLAQRGQWDVSLLLAGRGQFRGRGAADGNTDWFASAGLEVSAVDDRVTGSLQRQARASIARFKKAMEARESLIYADTLEPLVRIETLSASRKELIDNLGRFQEDYRAGVTEFVAGNLSIDNLLTRRETLFGQEEQIAELANAVGANVAELCSATGKFFELLGEPTK